VTTEALRANIGSKSAISPQQGPVDPKFLVEEVDPTNHSSCHKTRVNDVSCGIWMQVQLFFVLSQITILTDRRTDGQTESSSLDRVCIPCSAVWMNISEHLNYPRLHTSYCKLHLVYGTNFPLKFATLIRHSLFHLPLLSPVAVHHFYHTHSFIRSFWP